VLQRGMSVDEQDGEKVSAALGGKAGVGEDEGERKGVPIRR